MGNYLFIYGKDFRLNYPHNYAKQYTELFSFASRMSVQALFFNYCLVRAHTCMKCWVFIACSRYLWVNGELFIYLWEGFWAKLPPQLCKWYTELFPFASRMSVQVLFFNYCLLCERTCMKYWGYIACSRYLLV